LKNAALSFETGTVCLLSSLTEQITLFLFFFIQVFWPKKKFPCGNFYALTGKMRKRSLFGQILT